MIKDSPIEARLGSVPFKIIFDLLEGREACVKTKETEGRGPSPDRLISD